jgi:lipopolysaccharide transport system permease protein
MNPHAPLPVSLAALTRSLWKNRHLIVQMTQREVLGRYKGSAIGLAWSFLNPVLMLTVYSFVFSVVFRSRWSAPSGGADESRGQFAVILFVGMIVHGLFAEVVNRAPGLITGNVNLVKKVIFPLELLPVVTLGAAAFHACMSLCVLLAAYAFFHGNVNPSAVLIPVVLLPLMLLTLGIGWILASLGTFLRDIGQTVAIITSVMMFLSPVFYPISALPQSFQPFFMVNPLTFIIEQARDVLIWGRLPNWQGMAAYAAISLLVAAAGFAWFQKTRKGFADVL